MKTRNYFPRLLMTFLGWGFLCTAGMSNASAHCDTLAGPVVQAARKALEQGDVTTLLKWVQPDDEKDIRAAFQKTLAVRNKSAEAKELADMYFFETLVRIHRAAEGAPYTGLKPGAAIDPAVALADKALESGSVNALVDALTNAVTAGVRARYQRAAATQKNAERSVAAGREHVKAYVLYTHYAEALHAIIRGEATHHQEATGGHR